MITYVVEYPGLSRWGLWYSTREFQSLLVAYRFWKTRDKADLIRFKRFEEKTIIVSSWY